MARDYKKEAARANERARAKGYKSAYDYRIHEYGRIAPDKPPAPRGRRQRLRGHASARELLQYIRKNPGGQWNLIPTRRNKKGQFTHAQVVYTTRDFGQGTFSLDYRHLSRRGGVIGRVREAAQPKAAARRDFAGGLSDRGAEFFNGLPPAAQDVFIESAGGDPEAYSPAQIDYVEHVYDTGGESEFYAALGELDTGPAFDLDDIYWDDIDDWLDYYDVDVTDPYTGEL